MIKLKKQISHKNNFKMKLKKKLSKKLKTQKRNQNTITTKNVL